MRRTAIALLLLAAACAPREDTAIDTTAAVDTPAATGVNLADLSGTWTGATYRPDGSPLANVEMVAADTPDGWTINIMNPQDTTQRVSTGVRVISTTGDSLVTESGPYTSVVRAGAQVTVRSVYRLQDGRLVGTSHIRYADGDTLTTRSELSRR